MAHLSLQLRSPKTPWLPSHTVPHLSVNPTGLSEYPEHGHLSRWPRLPPSPKVTFQTITATASYVVPDPTLSSSTSSHAALPFGSLGSSHTGLLAPSRRQALSCLRYLYWVFPLPRAFFHVSAALLTGTFPWSPYLSCTPNPFLCPLLALPHRISFLRATNFTYCLSTPTRISAPGRQELLPILFTAVSSALGTVPGTQLARKKYLLNERTASSSPHQTEEKGQLTSHSVQKTEGAKSQSYSSPAVAWGHSTSLKISFPELE